MQVEVFVACHGIDQAFTYAASDEIAVGTLVTVPFRHQSVWGIIKGPPPEAYQGAIKSITHATSYTLSAAFMRFITQMAAYTMTPLGSALKMVLSVSEESLSKPVKHILPFTPPVASLLELSEAQDAQARILLENQGQFGAYVLDGVTGSGKTAVYFQLMIEALKEGKQVLILVPEIALTQQLYQRIETLLGCAPLVWHSHVTPKQKRMIWEACLSGMPCVVIGARSALFLPFENLGAIIVDEEHDSSYKQEEQVLYHARDMAVLRAKCEGFPIVLSSATPSLESFVNLERKKYHHLTLTERFHGSEKPETHLIDMRQEKQRQLISAPLKQALQQCFAQNQQALLFINRRGYAPLLLCGACGHRWMCLGCSTALVYHKSGSMLMCHHCGYQHAMPHDCPECHATKDFMIPCGPGVERVAEAFQHVFPDTPYCLFTSEEATTPKKIQAQIQAIEAHQVACVIGTQILAKGHHFPKLGLVAVIDADAALAGADLRASERTFQLIEQVSGRAGREQTRGVVYLQTYQPEHPILQALAQHDREQFYTHETAQRQALGMPPFGRMIAIIVSCMDEVAGTVFVKNLRRLAPLAEEVTVLGPIPAPLYKIRSRYRWRFLLKSSLNFPLQAYVDAWLRNVKVPPRCRLTIDVDPQGFY